MTALGTRDASLGASAARAAEGMRSQEVMMASPESVPGISASLFLTRLVVYSVDIEPEPGSIAAFGRAAPISLTVDYSPFDHDAWVFFVTVNAANATRLFRGSERTSFVLVLFHVSNSLLLSKL